MLSTNTFGVKEEQCQEDSFTEDKVCISETTITIGNAELQSLIRHGQIKQYEESPCMDNIKTKFPSFDVTEVQNDTVKIGRGFDADEIKTEIDNGLLYCEHCEAYYVDYCIKCGMLGHILNKNALNSAEKGSQKDIPNDVLEIQDCFGQTGIYALRIIPAGVKFGPFTGLGSTECPWEMKGETFVLDKSKSKYLNWMQYVNPTRSTFDQNLQVFQSEDNIYYQSTRQIQAGDQLLVYFGEEYGNSSNKIVGVDFTTTTKDMAKDIFACTFCCLGFISKSHLAKHKTLCIESTDGIFSIEELTQCPFCNIHLDSKEYFEHHMTFCCDRNDRKFFLPAPPTKQSTTALSLGQKRCPRETYKCEQCKYRTKYQADLRQHSKQHSQVKIYKCEICNRRFNTKETLRLHVKNTHAYVGGKNDQEHSMNDYRITNVKVEQSSSRDQKIFKCSLCVFRANCKRSFRRHIRTIHLNILHFKCHSCEYRTDRKDHLGVHVRSKHLRQFNFKCDSCKYGTNIKSRLQVHIKSKHLKQFSFKCDSCEYRTNRKDNLEVHIKTRHLKKLDFKCHSCEYRTDRKDYLEVHIRSKHLKKFDYSCDKCEFKTCNKTNLKKHIGSKHLKEYNFKCVSCEYRTNWKRELEVHIKTKHLMQFNFKCDSCDYRTNRKPDLEVHIKTNHLKQFNFKCDSCKYRTNSKQNLKVHIKTKHMKEFDFKCDSCNYVTNNKHNLEVHIKAKHLKQLDFKCHSCEYRTNRKNKLEVHIRSKHLGKFNFKCDSCNYGTNIKSYLEEHVKSKHLNEFDYKCSSCEYRTNRKDNLEVHIKRKK